MCMFFLYIILILDISYVFTIWLSRMMYYQDDSIDCEILDNFSSKLLYMYIKKDI